MNKRQALVLTFLWVSLISVLPIQGVFAGPAVVAPTPAVLTGQAKCDAIFAEAGISSTAPTTGTQDIGTSGQINELYVFLTETISGEAGLSYSCSEVVDCLRKKHRAQSGRIREARVFNEIKGNEKLKACVVTGKTGLDLLTNYASQVYQWIAGVVGAICILVIVVSGIQISIGGLSQEEVSTAKDRVIRALVGLVVLFLSAFILYTINPLFFT